MSEELARIATELRSLGNNDATLQQQLFYVMEEIRGEESADRVHVAITGHHNPERVLTIRALTMLRDQMAAEWKRQQLAEKRSA